MADFTGAQTSASQVKVMFADVPFDPAKLRAAADAAAAWRTFQDTLVSIQRSLSSQQSETACPPQTAQLVRAMTPVLDLLQTEVSAGTRQDCLAHLRAWLQHVEVGVSAYLLRAQGQLGRAQATQQRFKQWFHQAWQATNVKWGEFIVWLKAMYDRPDRVMPSDKQLPVALRVKGSSWEEFSPESWRELLFLAKWMCARGRISEEEERLVQFAEKRFGELHNQFYVTPETQKIVSAKFLRDKQAATAQELQQVLASLRAVMLSESAALWCVFDGSKALASPPAASRHHIFTEVMALRDQPNSVKVLLGNSTVPAELLSSLFKAFCTCRLLACEELLVFSRQPLFADMMGALSSGNPFDGNRQRQLDEVNLAIRDALDVLWKQARDFALSIHSFFACWLQQVTKFLTTDKVGLMDCRRALDDLETAWSDYQHSLSEGVAARDQVFESLLRVTVSDLALQQLLNTCSSIASLRKKPIDLLFEHAEDLRRLTAELKDKKNALKGKQNEVSKNDTAVCVAFVEAVIRSAKQTAAARVQSKQSQAFCEDHDLRTWVDTTIVPRFAALCADLAGRNNPSSFDAPQWQCELLARCFVAHWRRRFCEPPGGSAEYAKHMGRKIPLAAAADEAASSAHIPRTPRQATLEIDASRPLSTHPDPLAPNARRFVRVVDHFDHLVARARAALAVHNMVESCSPAWATQFQGTIAICLLEALSKWDELAEAASDLAALELGKRLSAIEQPFPCMEERLSMISLPDLAILDELSAALAKLEELRAVAGGK